MLSYSGRSFIISSLSIYHLRPCPKPHELSFFSEFISVRLGITQNFIASKAISLGIKPKFIISQGTRKIC